MKYLVYLQPPQEVLEKIEAYRKDIFPNIRETPRHATHCTVMSSNFRQEDEARIIRSLYEINQEPIRTSTTGLEIFDEQSLVLRLALTNELKGLHFRVVDVLREFIQWTDLPIGPLLAYQHDPERERAHYNYGSVFHGLFYSPHVSVATVDGSFRVETPMALSGINFQTSILHLSRKDKIWQPIAEIPLARRML